MADPGAHAVADRIRKQVKARLDGHAASGDAFVVSVYGEWGIGKTRCLKRIHDGFEDELRTQLDAATRDASAPLVVPVMFDPWQYEHEEHLVIPLLKTIEHTLAAVERALPKKLDATVGRPLKKAAGVVGDAAVALLAGFKFKFAPLKELVGLEAEFSPKDVIDAARAADQRRHDEDGARSRKGAGTSTRGALAKRESMYFDVRNQLAALTTDEAPPKLRLVVLIDDLDRCLPEKAIQVLESVKLFLNVPGFSFVIAVDDEIVERGITHRYRDYAHTGHGGGRSKGAPITGAEYLEKIVHLPVHLQRWTAEEAAVFLRGAYPRLFGEPKAERASNMEGPRLARSDGEGPRQASPTSEARRSSELVALAIASVPLVPRKLIRLAEALEFLHEQFQEAGALRFWSPLHAVRLVALEQLYPGLYRLLRLRPARYWRLFELLRNDYGEPSVINGRPLHVIRREFEERARSTAAPLAAESRPHVEPAGARREQTDTETLREQLTLLEMVDEVGQQRGSPDPLLLFQCDADSTERDPRHIATGLNYISFAQLYLHGVVPPAPVAVEQAVFDEEPIATVSNVNELLSVLTRGDTVTRREFMAAHGLEGCRLPSDAFEALLSRLSEAEGQARPGDIEWLRDVSGMLGREQLLRVYTTHKVIERVLERSEAAL